MKKFSTLYRAGRVTRYHTSDVPAQSLAAHSWGVAMIVYQIYPNRKPPPHLLLAALVHDLAELLTGDIPATAKWANPKLGNALREAELQFNVAHDLQVVQFVLTSAEEAILHWADTFELCLYCAHQVDMGNEPAGEILANGLSHLRKKGFPTTEAKELYDSIFSQ